MPGADEPIEQFQLTIRVPPGVRDNPAALQAWLRAMANKLEHNDLVEIDETAALPEDDSWVSVTMSVKPCGAR